MNYSKERKNHQLVLIISVFGYLWMALSAEQEEVTRVMRDHLSVSSKEEKMAYVALMEGLIFPKEGINELKQNGRRSHLHYGVGVNSCG